MGIEVFMSTNFLQSPLRTGFLVSLVLVLLVGGLSYQTYEKSSTMQIRSAEQLLNSVKDNMSKTIQGTKAAAYTMAMFINEDGEVESFEENAQSIIEHTDYIMAMQLVPDGIISATYPEEGNEAAIGLNILESSSTSKEAMMAIENGDMFFAGPLDLVQGGNAVIGRLPVYRKDKFWGFVAVLIETEKIIDEMHVVSSTTQEFVFEFSKRNPNTSQDDVFFSNVEDSNRQPLAETTFEESNWNIAVYSSDQYAIWFTVMPWMIVGLIFACLAGGITNFVLRKREFEFKALFETSSVGIFIIEPKGQIVNSNATVSRLLQYTQDELKTMTVFDLHGEGYYSLDLGKDLFLKIVEQGSVRLDVRFKRKDGTFIDCEASASQLGRGRDAQIQVVLRDISAIRLAEKEKLEILDSIKDGFLAINEKGEITFANQTALSMLNLNPIDHAVLWDLKDLKENSKLKEVCELVEKFNVPRNFEWYLERENKWLALTIFKAANGLTIYIQDVTIEKEYERQMAEENLQVVRAQSQLLSAQLNPHFLFNVLNSIQFYILDHEQEKALDFLSHFSQLIRKTLSNSRKAAITVSEEVSTLNNYFNLEKLRVGYDLQFALDVDEDLIEEEVLIPPMLLQPYIENAIIHAFEPNRENCLITVKIKKNNGALEVTIIDNGVGVKRRVEQKKDYPNAKHTSLATSINQERIKLLNKLGVGEFSVEITDLSDIDENMHGTQVRLSIPVIESMDLKVA